MKVIKLYGVHYLSQNGILLNSENNFVEATEENILKLHKFIENKYVKVVELDENGKEIKGTSYKRGQEKSTWENKYSPEGYLIEKAWKREKENPKTLYYYDAIGNCIKIEEYYEGKLTNIYERIFTYYK